MANGWNHQVRGDKALLVRCSNVFFLIDVGQIRRVEDDLALYPSPFPLPGFVGLTRFGGDPLSVFSLMALVEDGPSFYRDRMTVVVAEVGRKEPAQFIGLTVDEVLEILPAVRDEGEGASDQLVSGFFDLDGRQVRNFNVDALESRETVAEIRE